MQGQYMGLFKLTPTGLAEMQDFCASLSPDRRRSIDVTSVFSALLGRGTLNRCVPNLDPWGELDLPKIFTSLKPLHPLTLLLWKDLTNGSTLWLLFALAYLGNTFSPGPNVLMVLNHTAKYGYRHVFRHNGWQSFMPAFDYVAIGVGVGSLLTVESAAYH